MSDLCCFGVSKYLALNWEGVKEKGGQEGMGEGGKEGRGKGKRVFFFKWFKVQGETT